MNIDILQSAYISLIIQIITGLITFAGIFIKLKPEDYILTEILILETVVQFIEFSFYIWLIFALNSASETLITPVRYFDWIITTPTMLLTTIFFMEYNNIRAKEGYEENNEKKSKKQISSYDIYLKDYNLTLIILKKGLLNLWVVLK